MKRIFIDFNTIGHHAIYLNALISTFDDETVLVLPTESSLFRQKQYVLTELNRNLTFVKYLTVIKKIRDIVKKERPNIVHIVSGDFLYRYFGFGLSTISENLIVTFHHVVFSDIRNISYKLIFRNINIGVVHTEYIYDSLDKLDIKNVIKIEYPYFEDISNNDIVLLRREYRIPKDKKVLLAFGGTRYDKGLDILLDALKQVKESFYLVVAGSEEDINMDYIKENIKDYKDNVTCILSYIEQKKMEDLFALSDIVVLPYRRKFAGASGPLTTGVANGKMIIGPDCNSIGDIIKRNHLGKVFETENVSSLSEVIEDSIKEDFHYDSMALKYKDSISRDYFIDAYRQLYNSLDYRL